MDIRKKSDFYPLHSDLATELQSRGYILDDIIIWNRIIPIVDENIVKYFKWRQDESWKNCINSYGIWLLKSKYSDNEASDKIKGLKSNEIHELLFQDNINLNDVDNYKKRGIAIYRSIKKVEGYNKKENKKQVSNRSFINADWNIPIFNEKFFKEINVIK